MKLDNMTSELVVRLTGNIDDTGYLDAWFYHLIDKSLSKLCESPIEVLLGAAILFHDKFNGMPGYPLILRRHDEEWPQSSEARFLIPQYRFDEYRIDWVYKDGELLTFIECDGHDYHQRTKDQATRDKQRDRKIQSSGHPVLRFTGSEIHKDALHCAAQITQFVDDRNVPAALREHA